MKSTRISIFAILLLCGTLIGCGETDNSGLNNANSDVYDAQSDIIVESQRTRYKLRESIEKANAVISEQYDNGYTGKYLSGYHENNQQYQESGEPKSQGDDYNDDTQQFFESEARTNMDSISQQEDKTAYSKRSEIVKLTNGGGKITKEKFDLIKQGMSYSEVVDIIGSEGELIVDSQSSGQHDKIYMWYSDGFGNANVNFLDDEVINKTQLGVNMESAEATIDKYNAVSEGMSYIEVCSIMGGEGILMSESELMDYKISMYGWYGKDHISNCTICFENERVSSKTQIGLK